MTKQKEGQVSLFDQNTWSGKTCQGHSHQTAAKTSQRCSKKQPESQTKAPLFLDLRKENGEPQDVSWETDSQLLGVYSMRSFGESPKDGEESHLSQILEDNPPPKYYLSAKACQGILNRAERRGKALPEALKKALEAQYGACRGTELTEPIPRDAMTRKHLE